MVAENFQIYGIKITPNTFVSQKIESVHFYSYPQAKLSLPPPPHPPIPPGICHSPTVRRELPIPPFFEDIFF